MKITTIGIDLAKSVFQVHGVDEYGRTVLRKQLKRAQVAEFMANLPPCLVGIEACGSAHHWARKLQGYGHTVRLMSPQFVKPYVKSNKNDVADAEAICESEVGRDAQQARAAPLDPVGVVLAQLVHHQQAKIRLVIEQPVQIEQTLVDHVLIAVALVFDDYRTTVLVQAQRVDPPPVLVTGAVLGG